MQLSGLYGDFSAVLRSAPHGESVLSEKLLPQNSSQVAVADILSVVCETSIDEKLAAEEYSNPYDLFHDLKLAFGRLIAQQPQNAPEYDEISALLKFAVDLLVREANRLGFTAPPPEPQQEARDASVESTKPENVMYQSLQGIQGAHNVHNVSGIPGMLGWQGMPGMQGFASVQEPQTEDDHLEKVSQGFQRISTEIQDWNGETYWVTAANGPLFMSVNNKAPIDPRDTAVAGSVHTVKLLPHVARASESTLGVVSPLNPQQPQPDAPPTDLLSRFVHPNSQATFSPLWLTGQDVYSTFAPSSDSAGAVIGDGDAASVWADKADQLAQLKAKVVPSTQQTTMPSVAQSVTQSDVQSTTPFITPTSSESPFEYTELEKTEGSGHKLADLDHVRHSISKTDITSDDLEALLRWTPYSFIDNDELTASKAGKHAERELVSRLLLELESLQQERLAAAGPDAEISDKERHVAFKSANILSRLVDGASSEDINLQIDTRLPVLMRNYAGSLPAATDPFMHGPPQSFNPMPPQSQRLQTLAGLRSRSRSRR